MEIDIEFDKSEAKFLLEALDCHRKNWGFSYYDVATANSLSNKIVDAFKKHGIDLEADEDDDE